MSHPLTESFTALSNDSQRLFIRMYTRKGYCKFESYNFFISRACNIFYICGLRYSLVLLGGVLLWSLYGFLSVVFLFAVLVVVSCGVLYSVFWC